MRKIPLLIPCMPSADELSPLLSEMEKTKRYVNRGPFLEKFEKYLLHRITGTEKSQYHLTTTKSGTSALQLALESLNLPKGGYVLMPAFTFAATALAVIRAGLQPLFCDVDMQTWCLSTSTAIKHCDTFPVSAVVPVSAYGSPLPPQDWSCFIEQTAIPVVFDSAGAMGCQPLHESLIVIFSLHATKVIGAGEGGVIVSADHDFIEKIKRLTNFGFEGDLVTMLGTNDKLSEFHAAIGLSNLTHWETLLADNIAVRKSYYQALSVHPNFLLQQNCEQFASNIFGVGLNSDCQTVQKALAEKGIETRRYYLPPLERHPAFSHFTVADTLCTTRQLEKKLLCLPLSSALSAADIQYVCQNLLSISLPASRRNFSINVN